MSEGIGKQLQKYFEKLSEVGEMAIDALKVQIDIETDAVEQELHRTTPRGETGGLVRSLKRKEISSDKRYGYILIYEGEDEYGNSYEKIANILNFGSSTIKPRHFLTKAVKKLKGMDERVAKRFQENIR